MTKPQTVTIIAIVLACILLAYLMVSAWPATGSPGPIITPTTYGWPGPNGGPQ